MRPPDFIADRTLYAVAADNRGFEIHLAIGKPYQISEAEWACAVQVGGLQHELRDVHGEDSWQSLQLAHRLTAQLLGYFVEDGGRLFREKDGEPVQIADLF